MSKLAAASLAIDARLASMQDAIKAVLSAVDNVAPWDATLAAIDALRPFVADDGYGPSGQGASPGIGEGRHGFGDADNYGTVRDPNPGGLRIVPAAACHLCNPSEVCGLCKASLDVPRPTRESERAMRKQAEAAVAWGDAARAGIDLSPQKVAAASRAIGLCDEDFEAELMPPSMSEACAVEVEAFGSPIPHHPPADPTDAYTMDGSKFCAFCGLPSHGSRLCCGCAAEQSGLG